MSSVSSEASRDEGAARSSDDGEVVMPLPSSMSALVLFESDTAWDHECLSLEQAAGAGAASGARPPLAGTRVAVAVAVVGGAGAHALPDELITHDDDGDDGSDTDSDTDGDGDGGGRAGGAGGGGWPGATVRTGARVIALSTAPKQK